MRDCENDIGVLDRAAKEGDRITTIKDIARLAGVSITTVSKVMNGKDHDIGEATKKRVLELVERYDYRPNALASGLITKKTGTIGLLVPDITNSFFSEVIWSAENAARREGFNVILCNTDDDERNELEYLSVLRKKRVDGIVFISTVLSDHQGLLDLADKGMPLVVVDRPVRHAQIMAVQLDNEAGGYAATRHLIAHGHRKIGCITGPLRNRGARDRYNGYLKAIREAGIDFAQRLIFEGDYRIQGGERGAHALLQEGVSALFACNDMMAYGVYRAARELGLEIPRSLSVVGYDDIYTSALLSPPLTSVKQPASEIGATAAAMLIGQINGTGNPERKPAFEPVLSVRSSVAFLPENRK